MNFAEYLKKKDAQKIINKLAKKYAHKRIVLYGAGIFLETIFNNYDTSKLNIIGIADIKYNYLKEFNGFPVVNPYTLKDMDFDVLLIATYKDFLTLDFFDNDLFLNVRPKFKIDTLIKMSFWEYVKNI